jgi:hypothetical protein
MPSKPQRPTPSSQRIGLTLSEQTISKIDRARADIRERGRRAVDRNQVVELILSRTNFEELVEEFSSEGRIVV